MSLPNYDSRPIQSVKLPISKETINVKPYTVAQEQIILEAMVDIENKSEFLINIKRILQANIVEEYDIEKMFLVDLIYLNIKLRAMSKSETIQFSIECDNPECPEHKKGVNVFNEIEDIIFVRNSDKTQSLVKIDDKLSIELQPVKLNYIDYLASKNENLINDDDTEEHLKKILDRETLELALVNIAYSVKRVFYDNQVFDKFDIEELLENILANLTETQLQMLQDEKNKMANIYIKIVQKCKGCEKIFERVEDDFFVFLT